MLPPVSNTKLNRPTPRPEHVARARLLVRLDDSLRPGHRLTVVVGPAGYGKTALLAEWLRQVQASTPNHAVAWVALDEGDDDAARFWGLLVAALREASGRADFGAEALGVLRSPGHLALDGVIALILNDLAAIAAPVTLALDDYHVVRSTAIHGSLAAFLERLPPTVRVAIATRAEPPLGLARLRVRGELLELGAQDLRFTSAEVAVFLRTWLGDISDTDGALIEARTEGWAAGLQLAALALQRLTTAADRSTFIRAFTGSQRHVFDYLVGEVLQHQPEATQTFLLKTSILRRFTASACAGLLAEPADETAAARQLAYIDRAQLFLIPLDPERRWYRYHPLFAETLRARLAADDPARLPELHRRAARWFDEHDAPELAIHHALEAGDHAQAAELIRSQARPHMIRGELATLLGWIESLPRPLRDAHAWLTAEHGMALLFSGRLGEAEAQATLAETQAHELPDSAHLRGVLAALRAYAADARGDFVESLAQAHHADALLPAADYLSRGILPYVRGRAYLARGDLAAAEAAFAEMVAIAQRAGNIWTLSVAVGQATFARRLRGRLGSAETAYVEALQLADSRGERGFAPAAVLEAGWASLLYERNRLGEARRLLDNALPRLRGWGNPASLTGALATLARLNLAEGRSDDADAVLREAEDVTRRTAVAPATRSTLIGEQVRCWLRQGALTEAARWADALPATVSGVAVADDALAIAVARVRLAQGRAVEAVESLTQIVARAETGGRVQTVIEGLTLLALAQTAARQSLAGLDALGRAVTLADPEGYCRTFVDEGEPLRKLLVDLVARSGRASPIRAKAQRLLTAFSDSAKAQPGGLVEPLSDRELEILRHVQAGKSNREIAEYLVVSLATVKKHLEHAHAKLGVHSRTHALARARELGLL